MGVPAKTVGVRMIMRVIVSLIMPVIMVMPLIRFMRVIVSLIMPVIMVMPVIRFMRVIVSLIMVMAVIAVFVVVTGFHSVVAICLNAVRAVPWGHSSRAYTTFVRRIELSCRFRTLNSTDARHGLAGSLPPSSQR